ncbi:MAG: sirohydrochlorin cobaltochelatase [Spirochaetia bacterium]|nr:sirohydrochlorin cobaltochelatase [Spirochaetia bacterium]
MKASKDRIALVFIGHGSRNQDSNLQMTQFVSEYSLRHPEYDVKIGYIELSKPDINEVLYEISDQYKTIITVPLLFYKSGHAKNDISSLLKKLKEDFPETVYISCNVLGNHPLISELNYYRVKETGVFEKKHKRISVLFIGRGSSDPDANANLYRQARFLEDGRDFDRVLSCFEGVTRPGMDESADFLVRSRPDAIVVIPHFLFRGVLTDRIQRKVEGYKSDYPWISFYLAKELGIHENIYQLIDERIRQAVSGDSALHCDNCKYRHPMPGQEEHAGGLRALLWSIRHRFSHENIQTENHSHVKVEKHILVCGNADCASRGSIRFLSALRSYLKKIKMGKEFIVTQTSCMGHCSEGPTVVVYPDGIWYRGVNENDAEELVENHLLNDLPVKRLVDTIM